jgi:hypothetical protein
LAIIRSPQESTSVQHNCSLRSPKPHVLPIPSEVDAMTNKMDSRVYGL